MQVKWLFILPFGRGSCPSRKGISTERLDGLVLRIADPFQIAFDAAWFSRLANAPSMPDELMRKQNPAVLRNHFHKILLDFLRVGILRQVEPSGYALHMRIDHQA